MVKVAGKKMKPKQCCICDQPIFGGVEGVDFHYVQNRGEVRWYCKRCADRLMKGD